MTEKLNARKFALATGISGGIISLVCAILVLIAPSFTVNLFGAIFHGIDISQVANKSITVWGLVLGIIEIFIIGFIFGWILATFYNVGR